MNAPTNTPTAPAGSSPEPLASPTPAERPDVKSIVSRLTPDQRKQIASGKFPKPTGAPATPPATATTPAPAPAAAVAPATTTETPGTPAPVDAQPGDNPADDPGGEKAPNRFRFSNEEDQTVALFAKTHKIGLIEAARRLSAAAQPAAAPAAPTAEPPPDAELASFEKRITDANKLVTDLTAKRKEALDDLDQEKAAEISDKIADAKTDARLATYERDGFLKTREQTAYLTEQEQIHASRDRAFAEFPDLANRESVNRLALNAYIEAAKNDPARAALFQSNDWPEVLVREFSNKYGIKPKSAAGNAPAVTPAHATPAPSLKSAPRQAETTPSGARLLTSADGQAPGAPKPRTREDIIAAARANPALGKQVFQHLAAKQRR